MDGRGRSRIAAISCAFIAIASGCTLDHEPPEVRWDAPAPNVVSAWANEPRFAYNTFSDVDASGRWVVFMHSVEDGPSGVYLRDMRSLSITRLDVWVGRTQPKPGSPEDRALGDMVFARKPIDFSSGGPVISANGRYVAFTSGSPYLVPNDTNRATDVFRYDRISNNLELVSTGPDGRPADDARTLSSPDYVDPLDRGSAFASISADGRYIAFSSTATNLASKPTHREEVYVKDMTTGEVILVSGGSGIGTHNRKHTATTPSISDDGRFVAFLSRADDLVEGDTNRATDAFVADLDDGTIRRVSVSSKGEQLKPFEYVESASSYRDGAEDVTISGDGRVVAFASHANGLMPEDQNDNVDVFVHELSTGVTERVSVTSNGDDAYRPEDEECGNNGQCFGFIDSRRPVLTYDGRYVAFSSSAPRLTRKEAEMGHVFVHDRVTGLTVRVNRDYRGRPDRGYNVYPGSITSDGRWISFATDGKLLRERAGDGENGDVYLQRLPIPFEVA